MGHRDPYVWEPWSPIHNQRVWLIQAWGTNPPLGIQSEPGRKLHQCICWWPPTYLHVVVLADFTLMLFDPSFFSVEHTFFFVLVGSFTALASLAKHVTSGCARDFHHSAISTKNEIILHRINRPSKPRLCVCSDVVSMLTCCQQAHSILTPSLPRYPLVCPLTSMRSSYNGPQHAQMYVDNSHLLNIRLRLVYRIYR